MLTARSADDARARRIENLAGLTVIVVGLAFTLAQFPPFYFGAFDGWADGAPDGLCFDVDIAVTRP